ncbi:hypothetical protein PVAP13_5KG672614 [Panicum virgatum]|uniref:Uncharacterized protein n=1 Tax=Panicum virgatum TaxID=38727 RepID=A0A8T0T1W6_PANVG|nr:hypothetical protein PVAP13_5KG672614 [Panicum virgatum]
MSIENATSCIFVPLPNIIYLFYVPIIENYSTCNCGDNVFP